MKHIFITLILIQSLTGAMSQHTEGVITYEMKLNMHRRIPEERKHMKEMVPEYNSSTHQLLFDADESYYKSVEEEPEPDLDAGRQGRLQFRRPKNEVYVHASNLKRVVLREFMGKKYLIDDSIRMRPWKIGNEIMEVNGYPCRKATLHDEHNNSNIIAWYSDQFRPFLGPEEFNSLPGAVLLVEINSGERIITAERIELRPPGLGEIKIPSAKIKTTEAEYSKMVEEQIERIRKSGGNMIIRN